MPRRKTHEEYVRELKKKVPHIRVNEEYKGNRVPIEHYCTKHDEFWNTAPFNILQHRHGCKKCQEEAFRTFCDSRRKTDEQFRKEVEALGTGIKPRGEYKGTHEHMDFECKLGHIWPSTPHDILDGYGCPFCAGNAVLKGYNDLWTTNPEMANMLKDPDVGYEISRGSNREVDWVCPDCGFIKTISPHQVTEHGFACPRCSNGISYPNRFIVSLLDQLNVNHFQPEWSPEWVGKCRYDAYFIHNNQEYIVEMDGGIGHGGIDRVTGGTDIKGLERDAFKDQQAEKQGVIVIRIDCRYERKNIHNRFMYIKESVLNSQLSTILDLSSVNWDECNKDATKSLHMIAAQQYDDGKGIREISEELHVHYSTVYSWLKRMAQEGLCSYRPVMGHPSHQNNRKNLLNSDT